MTIHRGQTEGVQTLRGDDQSHGQTGGVAWLFNAAQSHGQSGGVAWLYESAQTHNQTGGVAWLYNATESHGMRGGVLYVRSTNAKVVNHLGGTVIWQEGRVGGWVETRREVKPDIKETP